jgi:hypothetical protein
MVFQVTAGGSIPVQVMNYGVKSALGLVEVIRDLYERNGKAVDAELRGAFLPPPLLNLLNEEQSRVAQKCLALEREQSAANWTPLKRISLFVEMWANYEPAKKRGERSIGIGKSVCELDCSAHSALAYRFAETGREASRVSRENGDLARVVVTQHSSHDYVWASVKRPPFPLRPREFVGRCVATLPPPPHPPPLTPPPPPPQPQVPVLPRHV